MMTDLNHFERQRLELFARHGFVGESRYFVDRLGRRTYLIARDEGRHPTVLIHGGISQAGEWALLAGHLPGPLIMPDRPGCGLSYSIDYRGTDYRREAVDWMQDLIEGIGGDQVDLVGNSMGGFFAICFALAHPERVRRLVLAGAPAGLFRSIPLFMRLWGNPVAGPLMHRLGLTLPRSAEALRDQVYASILVARPIAVPLDLLETDLAGMAIPGAAQTSQSILRTCVNMWGWRTSLMVRESLSELAVPTLFLWGDKDAFAPPTLGREIAESMPDARIRVIPEAGHLPYVDQPGTVAREIVAFLRHSDATLSDARGRVRD